MDAQTLGCGAVCVVAMSVGELGALAETSSANVAVPLQRSRRHSELLAVSHSVTETNVRNNTVETSHRVSSLNVVATNTCHAYTEC